MEFENQIRYKDQIIYYNSGEYWVNVWRTTGLIQVVFDELHEIKEYIDELTNNKLTK